MNGQHCVLEGHLNKHSKTVNKIIISLEPHSQILGLSYYIISPAFYTYFSINYCLGHVITCALTDDLTILATGCTATVPVVPYPVCAPCLCVYRLSRLQDNYY